MPVYEYRCPNCGVFELNQKITDEAKTNCPTCGAPVKKLISRGVGIIFKGSGFYCTDNRKNSHDSEGSVSSPKAEDKAATG